MNWRNAAEACKSLKLGGKRWRLPELPELMSLIQCKDGKMPAFRENCGNENFNEPAINPVKFPNTQSFFYWTSTARKGDAYYRMFVDFTNGFSNYNPVSTQLNVRCVTSE